MKRLELAELYSSKLRTNKLFSSLDANVPIRRKGLRRLLKHWRTTLKYSKVKGNRYRVRKKIFTRAGTSTNSRYNRLSLGAYG